MTWKELKEKAKELGYEYFKYNEMEQLSKDFIGCRLNFIETSGNVIVDIVYPDMTFSAVLCEHITVDNMYQIMLALR